MNNTYPIPPILKDRPIDPRGYVIPYFVPIIDGKPEFRYQDAGKRQSCLDHGLCSICGKKLYPKSFWFITGPIGLMNKIASDAPMHEDCARYSLNVCPHIFFQKAERRSDTDVGDPNLIRSKPDIILLVKADKIGLTHNQGRTYITFRPVMKEQYSYRDNRLTLDPVSSGG
jgi:hypothetical protein